MTKAELISNASKSANSTKASTEKVLNAVLESIQGALVNGKNVTLVGFGTFTTSDRQAREGRNPKTGDKINIPASKIAKFKPGKQLRDAVNN
ncbi:MAG: HU family DNA-binding protein [Deltaproteobacteria bacterium]|nr:HU family DNA-binding protein [Deltaproteobacteria bacterium]